METGVYQARLKRNKTVIAIRLALAVLLVLGGIGGTVASHLINERNFITVDAGHPVYTLKEGDYAKISSDDFYYSGVYVYEKDEDKPDAFVYFAVLLGDDGYLDEVVVIESKQDYREEETMEPEDRAVRTFKGELIRENDEYIQDYRDSLVKYFDFTEEEAEYYLSPMTISRSQPSLLPIWIASIIGLIALFVNLAALRSTKKQQKRMEGYYINETALHQFEMEYQDGCERFGNVDLTRNWLFNKNTGNTCVLPLREVVWLHQKVVRNYTNGIPSGSNYSVEVYFSDGGTMSLPAKKKNADRLMEAFAARCPQALLGHTAERQQAWTQDYSQIVRASREKAADVEYQAREAQRAEAQEEIPAETDAGGETSNAEDAGTGEE